LERILGFLTEFDSLKTTQTLLNLPRMEDVVISAKRALLTIGYGLFAMKGFPKYYTRQLCVVLNNCPNVSR